MANLNFSILDLLLFTGLILLFFRVKNNGFLKELVFISILFTYCYLTLNNLKTVYDYFDDEDEKLVKEEAKKWAFKRKWYILIERAWVTISRKFPF